MLFLVGRWEVVEDLEAMANTKVSQTQIYSEKSQTNYPNLPSCSCSPAIVISANLIL